MCDIGCLVSQSYEGWKHEQGSEMMFDHLWDYLKNDDVDVIDLSTDDVKFIKALIAGDYEKW